MQKKYTDIHQRAMASKHCRICLRTVAEVRRTALFGRASPDKLAGKLSALLQVLIEQAHDYRLPRLQEHPAGAREDLSCNG